MRTKKDCKIICSLFCVSQFATYHKRLLCLTVRTEYILNLVDVLLLHILTSWTEVLTWVELSWLVSEYLTDSRCHGET